jgi:WD40 repeat protein
LLTWSAEDGHFIGAIAAESSSHVKVSPFASARMTVVYGRTQESDADDDTAGIWDTDSGTLIKSYNEPTGFGIPALSPDGQVVAFSMPARDATLLVSLADGAELGTLPGEATFIGEDYGLDEASGRIGALLLERPPPQRPSNPFGGAAMNYRLWDSQGNQIASFRATSNRRSEALGAALLNKEFGNLYANSYSMDEEDRANVLFSPNGAIVAGVDSQDGGISSILTLYDVQSGAVILAARSEDSEYLETSVSGFSPDGAVFAAAYRTHIVLWDVHTGQTIGDVSATSNRNSTPRLAFDPQSRTVTTTRPGSEAPQVWDLRDGGLRGELTGHAGDIEQILYSADGRTIYSYGRDETVRIWNIPGSSS